jgi:hypothetical protein
MPQQPVTSADGYTAEQAAALIARHQAIRKPRPFDGRCPYIGPQPFGEADARLYFGREKQLEAILERIERGAPAVAIAGPPRVGKTSLVQAGVIFALRSGALPDSDRWLIGSVAIGADPLRRLCETCAELGAQAGLAADIVAAIRRGGVRTPADLHTFVDMALGEDAKRRLVLVIDPLEAICSSVDRQDGADFLRFFDQLSARPPARLLTIWVMRAEALLKLGPYPALSALIAANLVEVPMMRATELARAIVLPALEVGATIEPALVARLVNDLEGDPDPLTHLQTGLRQLFLAIPVRRGQPKHLTLADYIDFGPIREREEDQPAALLPDAPTAQPLRRALGEQAAQSHFARQAARLRRMQVVTAGAGVAVGLALIFGAVALFQAAQSSARADAAATAQALAQAEATRALRQAGEAEAARATAEARASAARQAEQAAFATRAVAEAAATQAIAGQAAALSERATAIALATSVADREQRAIVSQATASALATRASAESAGAAAVRATAEAEVKIVRSRELAAVAVNQLAGDPQLALLIAIEAERAAPTAQSEDALRRSLALAAPDEGALRHPAAVNDARLSPDGAFLLTGSRDRLARLWEIGTRKVLITFRGHQGAVTGVAFSPDGRAIATASADRTARIWDATTGQPLAVLSGHAGAVTAVAFSPDGRQLVTGGADRAVRVWDVATGSLLAGPFQQTAVISRVAFLRDGQIGVLTPQDALRLDPRDGAALGEWRADDLPPAASGVDFALYGHAAPARLADLDAERAVSVSADGLVRVHLRRRDALLSRAQSLAARELTCEERVRYLSEARRCS